jgi:hypothetical protein
MMSAPYVFVFVHEEVRNRCLLPSREHTVPAQERDIVDTYRVYLEWSSWRDLLLAKCKWEQD